MINDLNIDNIMNIYEKEISKNIKNKNKLYKFELTKMINISYIVTSLNQGDVGHNNYNIFLIYEPKCRLVMSLNVQDKIINHFLTRFILEKKLTMYLDMRNCATRKNMGTDYAIRLVKKYLEQNKKYDNIYILKIDISKYFYSIDHNVLKSLLKDKLDTNEYQMISDIIDSTNKEYVNKVIMELINKTNLDIPLYNYGKGLPIGNMTSQFLSIFYLYKLDHFIIHNLKCKYYVRYMDDFIIIDHNLDKLKNAKVIIKNKIEKEYLLKVNDKKPFITKAKDGFSFLGYSFKVRNHKTIVKVKQSNYLKIKKRVKAVKHLLNRNKLEVNKAFCTIMTYSNCYHFADNTKVLKIIDRYFYEK